MVYVALLYGAGVHPLRSRARCVCKSGLSLRHRLLVYTYDVQPRNQDRRQYHWLFGFHRQDRDDFLWGDVVRDERQCVCQYFIIW